MHGEQGLEEEDAGMVFVLVAHTILIGADGCTRISRHWLSVVRHRSMFLCSPDLAHRARGQDGSGRERLSTRMVQVGLRPLHSPGKVWDESHRGTSFRRRMPSCCTTQDSWL